MSPGRFCCWPKSLAKQSVLGLTDAGYNAPMATLWTLLLLPALTWPPADLSPAELARVQRGEVVQQRALRDGAIQHGITATIDAPPDRVFAVARDLCLRPPPENNTTVRLLAPEVAERALGASPGELDDALFLKLPALSCEAASAREVYYVYWQAPGRLMMPDTSAVIRQHNRRQDDGSYLLQTRQVAGGLGENARMDSDAQLLPLPDGRTVWAVRGVFGLPSYIPDFLIERWMKAPDSENRQLQQLQRLRQQVAAQTPAPVAAPATLAPAGN